MVLTACEPKLAQRGQVEERDMLTEITPGETTKRQVELRFGSPSSRSDFGQEVWYYMHAQKEAWAFMKPEITGQDVVAVQFDENDTVSAVKHFDAGDSVDLAVVDETTPTEGHSLSFMEQALGNVGRFNGGQRNPSQPRGPSGR
jgi:outer membrane protein assembly factor BamE (lipoprotein component of BamABCDE complex)